MNKNEGGKEIRIGESRRDRMLRSPIPEEWGDIKNARDELRMGEDESGCTLCTLATFFYKQLMYFQQ